jgi:hypothetical protein
VQGELLAGNLLLRDGLGDQLLGDASRFPVPQGPVDDVPAEDVADDVQVRISRLQNPQLCTRR